MRMVITHEKMVVIHQTSTYSSLNLPFCSANYSSVWQFLTNATYLNQTLQENKQLDKCSLQNNTYQLEGDNSDCKHVKRNWHYLSTKARSIAPVILDVVNISTLGYLSKRNFH